MPTARDLPGKIMERGETIQPDYPRSTLVLLCIVLLVAGGPSAYRYLVDASLFEGYLLMTLFSTVGLLLVIVMILSRHRASLEDETIEAAWLSLQIGQPRQPPYSGPYRRRN